MKVHGFLLICLGGLLALFLLSAAEVGGFFQSPLPTPESPLPTPPILPGVPTGFTPTPTFSPTPIPPPPTPIQTTPKKALPPPVLEPTPPLLLPETGADLW